MPLYAISGSQGTGKTTLIQSMQYPYIERKTSRSILNDWGVTLSEVNNNHELTIRFQDEILSRKIADEADAVVGTSVVLTERTFADLFVYALVTLGKENQYSDWLDQYYHKCVAAQRNYAGVFYLTAGHFTPVFDGVRGVNQHYSRMVDLTMFDYTSKMSSTFIAIETPDLSERQGTIRQHVLK